MFTSLLPFQQIPAVVLFYNKMDRKSLFVIKKIQKFEFSYKFNIPVIKWM